MGPLQYVSMYALQMIKKLQTEFIASLAPKQSVTDAFNAHGQEWVKHTVWVEECRSGRKTGQGYTTAEFSARNSQSVRLMEMSDSLSERNFSFLLSRTLANHMLITC
jgi:hypothetical protein